MAECIFCKMVVGEIPVVKVYEDETVLSFLDINPVSKGHTLLIPKEHYSKLHECPSETLAVLGISLGKIATAVNSAIECQGYNILCNNGRASGQLIEHVHFHIIPRNSGDGVLTGWPAKKYHEGVIEQLAKSIRDKLQPDLNR